MRIGNKKWRFHSVRLRLIVFVVIAIFLVVSMSLTAVIGLNSTYHSLSNLRDRSLNQMFFSMTLGVKTTQISTYTSKLNQTVRALEYKQASEQLENHIQKVHLLLEQIKQQTNEEEYLKFSQIIHSLGLLEKSVKELLLQARQRHILNTTIISKLSQTLLYLEHIKRLEKRTALLSTPSQEFISAFYPLEQLIETATKGRFSLDTFRAIQSLFPFLPELTQQDMKAEWEKLKQDFINMIDNAEQLEKVNLRIQFLTYQIDALIKNIDQEYSLLAQKQMSQVNEKSDSIQSYLSNYILFIFVVSFFIIGAIIFSGVYLYRLFGKRLYSITQSLTKLALGDKTATVPQQQRQDEIGELARAFDVFRQNVIKLENTSAQLAHSEKMRSIGHLTGGIAHDFNNFLAVIIGNLELVNLDNIPEKQAKRIQRALKAAENSAVLTQRLLSYARKQPLHPSAVDINQLLTDCTDLMKHNLSTTIQVKLDLDPNIHYAHIDKNQLETALVNLFVNAKDALNGQGHILIQSRQKMVQRTHTLEEMIEISIIDNGCGMSDETKKRIFEPFFTTKQNGKGSGLGLSMVYGFIRQSKGRVLVHSELNQGTQITLQLPIDHQQIHERTQENSRTLPIQSSKKLLLVEDKADLRTTLRDVLTEQGYDVFCCQDAESAIELLKHHQQIDYLLSDIVLSGKLTGIDIAHFVKDNQLPIHIILMTGNHSPYIEQLKPFCWLKKPFNQKELLALLENCKE